MNFNPNGVFVLPSHFTPTEWQIPYLVKALGGGGGGSATVTEVKYLLSTEDNIAFITEDDANAFIRQN